jgi:pimeloyl-ACP methyl ester carboxylesterase
VVAPDARGHGASDRAPADGSRAAHVPDAGHDVHLDNPDAWRKALTEFLA